MSDAPLLVTTYEERAVVALEHIASALERIARRSPNEGECRACRRWIITVADHAERCVVVRSPRDDSCYLCRRRIVVRADHAEQCPMRPEREDDESRPLG